MHDIISIGDATLDVFLQIHEVTVKCETDTEKCEICLNNADKIPVERVTKVNGAGNASNNAVGSSRLGMKTAIYSILGGDTTGTEIAKHWNEEGVDSQYVSFDKKRGTNYSTVINFQGERTILVYHEPRQYRLPVLEPARWIYVTSMAKGSEILFDPVRRYARRTKAKIVFQPGTFQLKLGGDRLAPLIAASEITIVNKEESGRIVGDSAHDVKTLLSRMRAMGCKIAVITDGVNGSYAFDGTTYWFCTIMEVPVIERTGCGDAYASAFVAALHSGKTIPEAMRWGTANSASVLGFIGPQAGLLTARQMLQWLKKFRSIAAQNI